MLLMVGEYSCQSVVSLQQGSLSVQGLGVSILSRRFISFRSCKHVFGEKTLGIRVGSVSQRCSLLRSEMPPCTIAAADQSKSIIRSPVNQSVSSTTTAVTRPEQQPVASSLPWAGCGWMPVGKSVAYRIENFDRSKHRSYRKR